MQDTWPDEVLGEPAILTPRHMLERLTWRIRRYETYLQSPDLDGRSVLVAGEKLDRLYTEYRYWFEVTEAATRIGQMEGQLVQLMDQFVIWRKYLLQIQEIVLQILARLKALEGDAP